jgi:hypothetical protein
MSADMVWICFITFMGLGVVAAASAEFYLQRMKELPEYGEVLFSLFPPFWLFAWFIFIGIVNNIRNAKLDLKRKRLTGQPLPLDSKEAARRRKAWDKYYTYMGEVEALGDDFEHPGPVVEKPFFSDPRGSKRPYPRCRYEFDFYYSYASDEQIWGPSPSTRRLSKLLDAATPVTLIRKQQEEFERLEREALGIDDTEKLIQQIDDELAPPPPSEPEIEHEDDNACCINPTSVNINTEPPSYDKFITGGITGAVINVSEHGPTLSRNGITYIRAVPRF